LIDLMMMNHFLLSDGLHRENQLSAVSSQLSVFYIRNLESHSEAKPKRKSTELKAESWELQAVFTTKSSAISRQLSVLHPRTRKSAARRKPAAEMPELKADS